MSRPKYSTLVFKSDIRSWMGGMSPALTRRRMQGVHREVNNTEPWHLAATVLHQAGEHGGPFVFMAQVVFAKAVFGEEPPSQ